MAYFTYLDGSGSALDPSTAVASVGGFVAHEDDWRRFEGEWQSMLTEFGVTELHMKHYAHSIGEFASWKGQNEKRTDFMRAVGKALPRERFTMIGATMPIQIFKTLNQYFLLEEVTGTPYTLLAMSAVAIAMQWRDDRGGTEPMIVCIEKGDNQQNDWRRYAADRIVWEPEYLVEPIILPKKWKNASGQNVYLLPFQAADFAAYEQNKAVTDMFTTGKTDLRHSLRQVVARVDDKSYWTLNDPEGFQRHIEAFHIPRRFNRFADNNDGRRRNLVDPLCYTDPDRPLIAEIGKMGYTEFD